MVLYNKRQKERKMEENKEDIIYKENSSVTVIEKTEKIETGQEENIKTEQKSKLKLY